MRFCHLPKCAAENIFYLMKQDIICAVHINFCIEYVKKLTHAVLFWKYILGNYTFPRFLAFHINFSLNNSVI